MEFKLKSNYKPAGDQPKAIKSLVSSIKKNKHTVLLGATATGKTFTMANVIEKYNKTTLVLAPNKTLANQLYVELKEMFPENRVEYYISNFDFYLPESYMPKTDTYNEKTSQQNWELEMMRVSATTSLLTRKDTIVVASVAAIFGHRNPLEYKDMFYELSNDTNLNRKDILYNLVKLAYERKDDLSPGNFVVRGDIIEISPSWTNQFHIRIEMFGDEIEKICEINSITKEVRKCYERYTIYPAHFHVSKQETINDILLEIERDLEDRINYFNDKKMLLEANRLEQRVKLDIEQLKEFGVTSGIENYSVYLDPHRMKRETPPTLLDYFGNDYLLVIDESHLTIPQLKAMYGGDRARKKNLIRYGFRLPSSYDNRPLKLEEFEEKTDKVVYVSATPSSYDLEKTNNEYIEQIIRPTGLLDPTIEVRPEENQLDDLMEEIFLRKEKNQRVIINTTTKKLSENISSFMNEKGLSIAYLHSEIKTLEREEIIRKLRIGIFDAIIGINLLREGIDIPEVSLVAILDANKMGFMRNTRSLIQLIGRAARNSEGKIIMYANSYSPSMEEAITETRRRRKIQMDYNIKNNIIPKTIKKKISKPVLEEFEQKHKIKLSSLKTKEKIEKLENEMKFAASKYDFETAIKLRDLIVEIKGGK